MIDDALLEELLHLERLGWNALGDGTGAAFYGALMTGDGVMVLAGGLVLDREAVVASLTDAPEWDDVDLEAARLVRHASDIVTLIYRATARRRSQADPFVADMTSTYVRDGGAPNGWRLSLYTQTPVGG